MQTNIRTTETLRNTLLDAIDSVKSGAMGVDQAKTIALLAEKVIGTADLELRHADTLSRLDKQGQGINPGPMVLVSTAEKKALK